MHMTEEGRSSRNSSQRVENGRLTQRLTTSFLLQDSDEGEEDEDMALQSGSEGTSSEPREDHTDTSSVEVTSSRPRRAATLRRAFSAGNPTSGQEAPEGRRRSTRSLSAYNQTTKYQPPKGQDIQVQTQTTH